MIDIPSHQVLSVMHEENPWWKTPGRLPSRISDSKPRLYLGQVLDLVKQRDLNRAVVLLGPRRVGKSFLIHHLIGKLMHQRCAAKKILYLQLDNPIYNGRSLIQLLDLYQEATKIDWRTQQCYVFFDEIQYLKNWEQHLKSLVDQHTSTRFTVSGSAAAALRMKSKESGAGRFTDFLLPPLTFFEYLHLTGQTELVEEDQDGIYAPDISELNTEFLKYLNYGGYPEVALSEVAQQEASRYMRSDVIDKVLLRDLPSLYGISDIQELNSLFTSLAFNTGGEVSLNELSKRSAVAKETLKRYLTYLEAAFLIKLISRVDHSSKRFQREHTYKVYLTNPSIRTGLFSAFKDGDELLGNMVETAIFSQRFHNDPHNLHYARWKDGEVDQVMLDPLLKPLWATEVKWSDRPFKSPKLLEKQVGFCRKNELTSLLVTTKTKQGKITLNGVKIEFIPAALHAYSIGREDNEN